MVGVCCLVCFRRFLALLSIVGLLSVVFSGLAYAQSGVVGVIEGDWFSYDFSFDWYSEDENMTAPDDSDFDYLLKGDCLRFDILKVLGSNVTGQFTIDYENGTEQVAVGWVDVANGDGEFSTWLISSGLAENDFTYASDRGELINETLTYSTPLGVRETNHIEYSMGNVTSDDYYLFGLNIYWDKEIGILVEMSIETEMMMDGNLTSASGGWKLAESNMMTVPEFSAPAYVAVIAIASVTVLAVKKRMYSKKNER